MALFLSQLAHKKMSASAYKATLPQYYIAKNKMALSDKSLIDKILEKVKEHYASERVNTIDGVKVDFEQKRSWVEAPTEAEAQALGEEVIAIAQSLL